MSDKGEYDWQRESGHVGEIVAAPDAEPFTLGDWIALVHPSLVRPNRIHRVPNPFKPGTYMEVSSCRDIADVVVDGSTVGAMSWAEDDSDLINVWGDSTFPLSIARDVAAALGGQFIAAKWVTG